MHSERGPDVFQSTLNQTGRRGKETLRGSGEREPNAVLGDLVGLNCGSPTTGKKVQGVEHYDEAKRIPIRDLVTESREIVEYAELPFPQS